MDAPATFLQLTEAKNKDLVPVLRGTPLHSLHNPRREAEVFANNHLAHLSKTHNLLILGLGFGYHVEEMAKILRLKHKQCRIVVLEAQPELVRLWNSYQKPIEGVQIMSAQSSDEIYGQSSFCRFLLQKPVVVVHQASFEANKTFYQNVLSRRAASAVSDWKTGSQWWDQWASEQQAPLAQLLESSAPQAAWLKAYWELKHAE